SVLGVTLGVAVLIIVISVMSGFDRQLRDKILGFSPHLRVVQADRTMKEYQAIMRLVASNHYVTAVAPYVLAQVMIETQPDAGQSQVAAPWMRGVDAKLEPQMSSLATNLLEGKFDVRDRGVLVGSEFARSLGLAVGERLLIYSPIELR